MKQTIAGKIADYLQPVIDGRIVADVRIGVGYTCVRLDDGNTGLAWTPQGSGGNCTHEPRAGTLAGSAAGDLLDLLIRPTGVLSRTIGLATANALNAGITPPESTALNVMDLIEIRASDRVVMVGFFGPLIPRIREIGCRLDILELDREKPGTIAPEEGCSALSDCDVAIITATSIITGTIDELLGQLGNPRAALVLGPSTFMRPEVYAGTSVTHIGGARVRDGAAVATIISEGGGTMVLKPYLDFETIVLRG